MSGLYQRIHGTPPPVPVRLCVDCGAHEAIPDGARCRECSNALLRETRPATVRRAAWIERAKERPHGLAKDLSGSAVA